jgi:hypothetical protein
MVCWKIWGFWNSFSYNIVLKTLIKFHEATNIVGQLYGLPHGILHVFNTILYENEFQNPQIFQQTISLFPEQPTLNIYIIIWLSSYVLSVWSLKIKNLIRILPKLSLDGVTHRVGIYRADELGKKYRWKGYTRPRVNPRNGSYASTYIRVFLSPNMSRCEK